MAIDAKYGRVTLEHGTVAEDEPVFVIRGQDRLAVATLLKYQGLCEEAGSPQEHLDNIQLSIERIDQWQDANFTRVPTSNNERIA